MFDWVLSVSFYFSSYKPLWGTVEAQQGYVEHAV